MINKRKKRLIAAACICMSLTGCAGDSGNTETTTAASQAQTTEQVQETTTQAPTEPATEPSQYSDEMRDITAMDLVKDIRVGWNLGNTLDATSDYPIDTPAATFEIAWGAQYTSQIQIDKVLEAGFNVIRIPVSWNDHIHDDENFTIEQSWMDRVQQIVDYAYKRGAYVILNTHHEEWCYAYPEDEETAAVELAAVWTQIGTRFADYGDHLIFEGLNEPRKVGSGNEWYGDDASRAVVNRLEKVFYDTVRGLGGKNEKRFLMITGYAASSSTVNLKAIELPNPDDDHLIISVHAYIPYSFALDKSGTDKWNNDTRDIDTLMKDINELFISKGVPVIIGEYGAMNKSNEAERVKWVDYYVRAAGAIGVPVCWWDNHSFSGNGERFGLLRTQGLNMSWAYPDLLNAMMKAVDDVR